MSSNNFLRSSFYVLMLLTSQLLLSQAECDNPGNFTVIPDPADVIDYNEATDTYTIVCNAQLTFTSGGVSDAVIAQETNPGLILTIYSGQPTTTNPNNDPNNTLIGIPNMAGDFFLVNNGDFTLSDHGIGTCVLVPLINPDLSSVAVSGDCSSVDLSVSYTTFIVLCEDCEGVEGGTAIPGSVCDDADPNTINDVYTPDCLCVGEPVMGDCVDNPVTISAEFECDVDQGEFTYTWTLVGVPTDDPLATYRVNNGGFNNLEVFASAPLFTNTYNDGVAVDITVTDANDCEILFSSEGPVACTKSCGAEIEVEVVSIECDDANENYVYEFTLSGGLPEIEMTGDYIISLPESNTLTVAFGETASLTIPSGSGMMISVADNDACTTEFEIPVFECTENFDCPNGVNIGDACQDESGDDSVVGDDCVCVEVFDCGDGVNIGDACEDVNGSASTVGADCACTEVAVADCPDGSNIGDTCNDANGNASTVSADCECTEVAVADCPDGSNIGDACDDVNGNASTVGTDCSCIEVTVADCPDGSNIGDACDDVNGNASTVGTDCACTEVTVTDCPDGSSIGDDCEDVNGNASAVGADCECIEVTATDCPNGWNIGDDCDDVNGNPSTVAADCGCTLVFDCPDLNVNIGDPCDDSNNGTENDLINADCNCAGTVMLCAGNPEVTILDIQICNVETAGYEIFFTITGGAPSANPNAVYTITGGVNTSVSAAEAAVGLNYVISDGQSFSIQAVDENGCSDVLQGGPVSCTKVLSVSLTDFSGEIRGAANELSWTTASETDNDVFVVERSADGNEFETVGQVQGAGNSLIERNYSFLDQSIKNESYFYRLRSVEFSGLATYSKVILLNRSRADLGTNIYPNPFSDFLLIESLVSEQEMYIYHNDGRVLYREELEAGTSKVDLSFLPVGLYFVKIVGEFGTYQQRLVKN